MESPGSGYYGAPGEYCDQCPGGAVCTTEPVNEPQAVRGWWRQYQAAANNTKCPERKRSRPTCPVMIPCVPNKACLDDNVVRARSW